MKSKSLLWSSALGLTALLVSVVSASKSPLAAAQKSESKTEKAASGPANTPAAGAQGAAATPADMKPYTETIPGTNVSFDMVPLPGGSFVMGSPPKEKGRGKDEGPQREVSVRPFYMGKHEVTWDIYHLFLDIGVKQSLSGDFDDSPDALTYPTPPYSDETFGYGRGKQPNIAVTWHAAMELARWISDKTGKSYRLPTEAEWEYACRAGTQTPYSFGASPAKLGDYAWFASNSKKQPHPVGGKKPSPWGLFDMHGNVSEWVIDRYDADFYARPFEGPLPINLPSDARYPHVVRGGSWKEKAPALRCAARRFSERIWSKQDPQNPQSIWWHTEVTEVGFRFVYVPDEYPALKGFRSKMTDESPYK
jgi:formylglycine-generating enzyme required for sulfatase activity